MVIKNPNSIPGLMALTAVNNSTKHFCVISQLKCIVHDWAKKIKNKKERRIDDIAME